MSVGLGPGSADRQAAATAAARQVLADHYSDDKNSELFGVTELCNAFDVTPRTLRFYEDKGLLSPRRINGTRVYSRRDRARLALILRAGEDIHMHAAHAQKAGYLADVHVHAAGIFSAQGCQRAGMVRKHGDVHRMYFNGS